LVTLTNVFFATTIKIQKVPFKGDDLLPIANFMEYKLGIIAKGDSPFKKFNDLLDYGKKNPGKIRWSHPGRGTTLHMNLLLIFRKVGVEAIDIPYKGGPEQLSALLGGHVDASAMPYGAVKDHVKAGKVRFLIFFSDRRYSDPSDVPSSLELGFPEASKYITVVGLFVHKNTPGDVKKILIDAFKKTYEDPEFKKGIERIGEEPRFGGPDFLKDAIAKGEEVGVPIIKELGLYLEK
jgi:tripartite-type tricarboxylate transporter receptor subunit TctC